jgi:hypothetical protein
MEHAISVYPWVSPSEGSGKCKKNIKRCVVAEFSMRAAADGHAALDSRLPSDGPTVDTLTAACMDRKPSHNPVVEVLVEPSEGSIR